MSFPVSPTNGQQSTIANIVYQYASATNSWTVVPGYANAITATGNIAANYFLGDGSQLTGIAGGTQLTYGTTNLGIGTANGNANITVAGTSNVAVFSTGGANVSGYVTATGNITGSYIFGNGSQLTGITGGGGGGITWTTVANTAPANVTAGSFWYNSYTGIKYQYTDDGTGNFWVDQSSPTTFSSITTNQILNGGSNGTGNIGTSATTFNTIFAKATSAQYADLAEKYVSDADYTPGTVVVFGGKKEITISNFEADSRVAGVISTDPAFIMNSGTQGLHVALTGRVPCQVKGPVNKGDVLITSDIPGTAQCIGDNWKPGCVIGKSLDNVPDGQVKIIEVVVGRF